MKAYRFFAPTEVRFGAGQLGELHTLFLPGRRALLVTSSGKSAIRNGSLAKTADELEKAGCESVLFNQITSNPLKQAVEEGAQLARESGCDFVVALGGGSVLDAAKCIAMLAPQETSDLWDYAHTPTGKGLTPENPALPWVAIPTSSGTGSEVDPIGAILYPEADEKAGIGGLPSMMARYAIVDPELMRTVPPKFTLYQGYDALAHCMEGYLSKRQNPMADMVQRTAIEHIGRNLARAVRDGDDIEARSALAFASTLGGYSLGMCGCISGHAMEQAMNVYHPEIPHGAALLMLSEAYFGFWVEKHVAEDRFVALARFLGKADATRPEDFLAALRRLKEDCGAADLRLSDYGVTADEAKKFAHKACTELNARFQNDPAETTEAEIAGIYERAIDR